MNYCKNCGAELGGNEKFCPECGAKTDNKEMPVKKTDKSKKTASIKNVTKSALKLYGWKAKDSASNEASNTHKEEFYGKVRKCPNCGAIVQSFEMHCSVCGYEYSDDTFLTEFSNQMHAIERKNQTGVNGVMSTLGLGSKKRAEEMELLIRTVNVPNTKEALLGFLMMAISNIDSGEYGASSGNEYRKLISDAWKAKAEQLMKQAQLTLKDDSDFQEIREMYDGKMAKEKYKKLRELAPYGLLAILLVVCMLYQMINH